MDIKKEECILTLKPSSSLLIFPIGTLLLLIVIVYSGVFWSKNLELKWCTTGIMCLLLLFNYWFIWSVPRIYLYNSRIEFDYFMHPSKKKYHFPLIEIAEIILIEGRSSRINIYTKVGKETRLSTECIQHRHLERMMQELDQLGCKVKIINLSELVMRNMR